MTQVVLFNVFNGLILGAYIAYSLMPTIGFWGALVVAPFLTALIGLAVERVLIRPLYGRDPLYGLLLTFGLAYILEDGTRFIWGAQSVPFQVPTWLTSPLSNTYFFLTGYRLFMILVVGVAVGGLFAILNYTRLGIRIRAGTRDLETVSTLGVNVRVLRSLNFGIGIYIAGLAGVLAAGLLGLSPTMGASLLMPSFVAIIVGGLGSLLGTLLGGLLIGVASGITTVFFPSASEAVIYVMMGLVLLIRPRGLLGEEGRLH
jgi:branched-chain amino acid transport system permease protein